MRPWRSSGGLGWTPAVVLSRLCGCAIASIVPWAPKSLRSDYAMVNTVYLPRSGSLVPIRALGSQGGWRVCQTAGIVACFWMLAAVFVCETEEFGLVLPALALDPRRRRNASISDGF
ncbi:unnamed protein product [Prorocentrum cordatum]|uniref:Secreted protein n=1 Tax=Prorocentrum cordatum TaxID=2364126 RepID=A0ABN9Q4R7_9DINO|nr:unnamed protein product [Polarella glacialis]